MKLWHHFFDEDAIPTKSTVVEALNRENVGTYPLDLDSPSGSGVVFFCKFTDPLCDLLREISRNGLERVLVVAVSPSGFPPGCVWRLLQAGAADVFVWDHRVDPAREVADRFQRWEAVDRLVCSPLVQHNLVGKSPNWTFVLRQIVEVAYFTDASILISGESGTGKELVARLVHTLDQRPHKHDLVVLDCTTIVPDLSGSEFFGHERGAFTGAVVARDGAFALGDGGTLFLDEVGDLPLALQAELLRVVQEHTYKRVGSNTWQHTDFRLVCAANRDLLQEVERGRFRRDLYYRIAGWPCRLPALRERSDDILPLTHYFIQQFQPDKEPPELDSGVREYLVCRDYPGNVRDLKQLVARMMYRHVGPGPITVGCIPEEERMNVERGPADWRSGELDSAIRRALSVGVGLKEIRQTVENIAIHEAVSEENGSLKQAARRLGVTERALQLRRAARRRLKEEQGIA
jgi:transcriptional regulator with GAF, ATPase, and Fis domain